jgi:hypothetical protein
MKVRECAEHLDLDAKRLFGFADSGIVGRRYSIPLAAKPDYRALRSIGRSANVSHLVCVGETREDLSDGVM